MNNLADVGVHAFSPWAPVGLGFGILGIVFAAIIVIVLIVLKGYALWHAAKRNERAWFIVLLIVNTLGILELVYLAFVVKKWSKKV